MTTLIHAFPSPPAFVSAMQDEARREAIVEAARAILRSAADHTDAMLTEACWALKDHADPQDDYIDHLQADAMLQAIQMRQRRAETPRDVVQRHADRWPEIMISAVAVATAILAATGWL